MSDAPAEAPAPAVPFSRRAALGLAAAGILAFAAFLVFAAFAPDTDRDLRGGSALSDSAVGFAGLVTLLRAEGIAVTVSRVAPGAGRRGLLVLTPPPGGAPIPQALLDDRAGPVLVVLPKWWVRPLKGHPGWVEAAAPSSAAEAGHLMPRPVEVRRAEGLHRLLRSPDGSAARPIGPTDPLQTVAGAPDWTPVLVDEAGEPVLVRRAGHRVYLLADPDLLDTQGLATLDGARTAQGLVEDLRAGGPVTFDVTLDGFGAPPSLLRLLFAPPLLGATLSAAAAGLLILLMALVRFGPAALPDRVHDFGKRALADNSAGLIVLAGREARMAVPYARLVRGLALDDIEAPARLDAAAADGLLDAASRSRGLAEDWTALAALAAGVRTRTDLMAAAARLDRWRRGMTRDHR